MHNEPIHKWFSRRQIITGINVELKTKLERRKLF